jgi:hypothetical protein
VDGISQEKLAAEPLALGEKLMFSIALDAITMKEDLK